MSKDARKKLSHFRSSKYHALAKPAMRGTKIHECKYAEVIFSAHLCPTDLNTCTHLQMRAASILSRFYQHKAPELPAHRGILYYTMHTLLDARRTFHMYSCACCSGGAASSPSAAKRDLGLTLPTTSPPAVW